jgi:hypothetical protein
MRQNGGVAPDLALRPGTARSGASGGPGYDTRGSTSVQKRSIDFIKIGCGTSAL